MKNLLEQVKDIFKETVSCKNCPHRDKDGYCKRIEEYFGMEVRTTDKSTCICLDGFETLPEEDIEKVPIKVETERTYCKDCPDFEDGICMEAYYKNQPYEVSENDYCDSETKWYQEI